MAVALRWKRPAAPKRCRIILCPEFAGAFLLSDRVLRDCTPKGTSSRFARRAPRRLAPHNDTSGGAAVHQRPPAVEYPVHGAQERRYSQIQARTFGDALSISAGLAEIATSLRSRNDKSGAITVLTGACTSRQRCAGSGMPPPTIAGAVGGTASKFAELPMALTPVRGRRIRRRQSRQRLRSERRNRRNWLVRFCRQPVRIASACRIPIADTAACAATHEKQTKFRKIPLFFYYGVL